MQNELTIPSEWWFAGNNRPIWLISNGIMYFNDGLGNYVPQGYQVPQLRPRFCDVNFSECIELGSKTFDEKHKELMYCLEEEYFGIPAGQSTVPVFSKGGPWFHESMNELYVLLNENRKK